jgi:hypothetical protein
VRGLVIRRNRDAGTWVLAETLDKQTADGKYLGIDPNTALASDVARTLPWP